MPALVVFGRKWEIGSDDLVYPGIRNLFIRIPWFIGTVVIYWQNKDQFECNDGNYILYYLYGSMGILSLMVLADICLIYNSASGGIMDVKARRFVPFWLYIKLLLYMMELGWNSLGTYGWKAEYFNCANAPDAVILIKGIIICNWIMLSMFLFFWLWQYDPFGRPSKSEMRPNYGAIDRKSYEFPVTRRTSQWERRLRLIFCCVCNEGKSRTMQDAYKEISRGFSYMFLDSNLVMSDIIAGAAVLTTKTELRRKRIAKERYDSYPLTLGSTINFDAQTKSFHLPVTEEWNSISNILHYLNYAIGIFTFPAVMLFRTNDVMKAACSNTHCCGCIPGRKKYSINADHDTCCYWKTASLSVFVKEEDIVYASYDNSDFCCPFYVALDSSRCSIDIVIRGSFSFVDFLVDFSVTPTTMDVPGLPAEFKAHHGMLACAKSINSRLAELELLEKLTELHPTHRIMVTGISLGAGVASLLAMILRVKYPNTKCIAFSVPGTIVSLDAAEYCNSFVTAVVYGDDIVPRLGVTSFRNGLHKVQSVLKTCHIPKYRIQLGIGSSLLGFGSIACSEDEEFCPENTDSEPIEREANSIGGSNNSHVILVDDDTLSDPAASAATNSLEHFRQYPPGKILYMTETPFHDKRARRKAGISRNDDKHPKWDIRWSERSEFKDLIFSDRMLIDHLPLRMLRSLQYFSRKAAAHEVSGKPDYSTVITSQIN